MALRRCLVEFGTGVDLHGKDSTRAARRAVADALRHCSPSFPAVFGHDSRLIFVEVNIAVPHYETVRPGEVLLELPYGRKSINVVEGGLEVPREGDNEDTTIMANAAVIVSLDVPE
ncbi:MAG: Lin0512 family protein [Chloroflexi bacterium]|nr:Lin0512 family protein [Chloroflexota bacterium]